MRTSRRRKYRFTNIRTVHGPKFRAGVRERGAERFMKSYVVQEVEEANAQALQSWTIDDLRQRYGVEWQF